MNIAFVYDRVNKWGGAERVLTALHEIWPKAPLYTAVYDRHHAPWAKDFDVRPSFLQKIPFVRGRHEYLGLLTPLAFETFRFDDYDVVLSVTSAVAKNIITKPGTTHICYCLTPTRYLWSGYDDYINQPGMGMIDPIGKRMLHTLAPRLRKWDLIASKRPDYYIAISKLVSKRIKKYYDRSVDSIIYPPVETCQFTIAEKQEMIKSDNPKLSNPSYFLLVSRLVSYKRVDIAIKAFNELELPLVIIGNGRDERRLRKLANKNITFLKADMTDSNLVRYYQGCRAFVFTGEEDFGIVAAEAQSCGKSVIAYKNSGIAEIVKDYKTGILFDKQDPQSLVKAIKLFLGSTFSARENRENAKRFDTSRFKKEIAETIERMRNDQRRRFMT